MGERMGNMNLALALEGRAKPAPENEQLVQIAESLASLPDPEIDTSFMVALEQRLVAEMDATATPTLHAVPDTDSDSQPEADQVAERAPVVQMPSRRFTVRRSVAAVATAASLAAFPVVAAAQSLPGSPFYGLKTTIEKVQLWAFGTPLEDAQRHIDLANARISEAEQLIELNADTALIEGTIAAGEDHLRNAGELVLANTDDADTIRALGEQAADAEERLRSMEAAVGAGAGDELDSAIDAAVDIQEAVNGALGITSAPHVLSAPTMTAPTTDVEPAIKGSRPTKASGGSSAEEPTREGDTKDDDDVPTARKLSEAAEGCQVAGSSEGLGDLLAPLARVSCTY